MPPGVPSRRAGANRLAPGTSGSARPRWPVGAATLVLQRALDATIPGMHQPRHVSWHGVERIAGWPIKVYGLTAGGPLPEALLDAARRVAAEALPRKNESGAGFVIAHRARPACFVLVYWWATPVDLCLSYFRSSLDAPDQLEPMPTQSVGCVWELALTEHERQSWLRHVLAPAQADFAGYLDDSAPLQVR